MNFMGVDCPLEEIKFQIKRKQIQLNEMVVADITKEELLRYSEELDKLIEQYYSLELNKNRTK